MTIYSFPMTNPVAPVRIRREMDRLIQDVFGNGTATAGQLWLPATDAVEDPRGFTLEIEMPGVAPEEVELLAEDGVLIIRGAKRARSEGEEGSRTLFTERHTGSFERRFRLPKSADLGNVEARYAHGVLMVRVPKVAPAQPRRVQIAVDQGQVGGAEEQGRLTSES